MWGRKDISPREIAMLDSFDIESVLITSSFFFQFYSEILGIEPIVPFPSLPTKRPQTPAGMPHLSAHQRILFRHSLGAGEMMAQWIRAQNTQAGR